MTVCPMSDFLELMKLPIFAAIILVIIHAYLGLHVVKRGVIFVDLALAQVSAFGATVGFLWGFALGSTESYVCALAFTMIGAAVFTLTRSRHPIVPQEALIGIVYAVSAAAVVLVLSRAPDGGEELKNILVGHLLFVTWDEVKVIAILYAVIGIAHFFASKRLLLISDNPRKAFDQGIRVHWWDFFFYATFGLVVTNAVQIAGVLLVFAFLITPAVCGVFLAETTRGRLLVGWATGIITSIVGIAASFHWDLPTGAAVVCTFGVTVIVCIVLRRLLGRHALETTDGDTID